MSAISRFFFGKPGEVEQVPRLNQQQQQLINQLIGGLGGQGGQGGQGGALQAGLGNLTDLLQGGPEALEAFQAPAIRQFQEQIIPGIAEQFAGADALDSSGFRQSLSQAGAGLAENLAAQRGGLQQNALSQLLSFLGISQQPQFENVFRPQEQGFLQGLAPGIGKGIGAGLTGGVGGLIGGAGSLISSLIGGNKQTPATGAQS